MQLVCVRHGRTAWNADRRFQGQTDIPLDAEGLAQAQALAVHLRAEPFDYAVASDLTRARTTAEAILAGRDLPLELDPGLREMRFGVWEGMTWEAVVARWPELGTRAESSPRHDTPEGGEAWDDLCARIAGVLHRIGERVAPDAHVLIVSHAGVMHAMLHAFRAADADADDDAALRVRLVPAAIVRAHGSFDRGWTIDAINETAPPPVAPA